MIRSRPCVPHAAWLAALLAVTCGCSSIKVPWRKVPLDAATGFYEQASLTYRIDAGKRQHPLDVVRVDGRTVSYEQVASSPLADQSLGTLSITYPHPAGRAGFAQVRFLLESNTTRAEPARKWNPWAKPKKHESPTVLTTSQPDVHESWLLDIPSAESDQIFKLLFSQGFYKDTRPEAGISLTVNINGQRVHKPWDQVAELDALVQRVRREGQLLAYTRPGSTSATPYQAITSTRAYADLLAKTSGSDGPQLAASTPSNPFAMPQAAFPETGRPPQDIATRPTTVR